MRPPSSQHLLSSWIPVFPVPENLSCVTPPSPASCWAPPQPALNCTPTSGSMQASAHLPPNYWNPDPACVCVCVGKPRVPRMVTRLPTTTNMPVSCISISHNFPYYYYYFCYGLILGGVDTLGVLHLHADTLFQSHLPSPPSKHPTPNSFPRVPRSHDSPGPDPRGGGQRPYHRPGPRGARSSDHGLSRWQLRGGGGGQGGGESPMSPYPTPPPRL